MSKTPVRQVSQARYDLPTSLTREIGRIIVAWAFIEHLLQKMIWELAGVDEPVGRLAVREPRAVDRLNLIVELALLRGIKLPAQQTKELRKYLEKSSLTRDVLAHGAWSVLKEEGVWIVVLARGSYPHQPTTHSRNRRVDPEALRTTPEALREIRTNSERLIESVRNLGKYLRTELASSDQKSPKQS